MRKSLYIVAFTLVLLSISSAAMAAEPAGGDAAAGVVNINSADADQLALLPRIGEKGAQRIIEYRTEHGPFKKTSDLMQVKGVGAKTFEGLSPYVTVEGKTTLSAKVKSPRRKKPATTASN
jgi:competence ComEA-like helix-hairpin-helix protein